MRKRRERIEKWREEKKLKEGANKVANGLTQLVEQEQIHSTANGKKWNLEDDDEDETQQIQAAIVKQENIELNNVQVEIKKQIIEDERDPLNSYIKEISKQAKPP